MDAASVLDEILEVDEKRRASQAQLDEVLAESNRYSREIGNLFKSGEVEKANALKTKSADLKESTKELSQQMQVAAERLQ